VIPMALAFQVGGGGLESSLAARRCQLSALASSGYGAAGDKSPLNGGFLIGAG
jgi:hypothetical protein